MKYVKMLGLLAVAAAALTAFVGSASATLTEGPGDPVDVGDVIHATSEETVWLTGTLTLTCHHSTAEGQVTSNGSTTASGPLNVLTFSNCTNHTVTVVKAGELTVHSLANNTGTVTSTGAEITVLLHSFLLGTVHCIYTTNATDIGILTGSGHGTNTTATLDVSATLPRHPTDGACGDHATWEGSYTVETPDYLTID